jgi:hypothetical protein
MKQLVIIIALVCLSPVLAMEPVSIVLPPKGRIVEPVKPNETNPAVVHHFVEGILLSDDMTTKMPVLQAAFRDDKSWETGLKKLITEEKWVFAKVHFIHFYWKNVSDKDKEFMEEMFSYITTDKEAIRQSDGLGNVEDLIEYLKGR